MNLRIVVTFAVLGSIACSANMPAPMTSTPAPSAASAATDTASITTPLPVSFSPEAVQAWARPFRADALGPDTQWVTHFVGPASVPSNVGASIIREGRVVETITVAGFVPQDQIRKDSLGYVGSATTLDDGALAFVASWSGATDHSGGSGVAFRGPDGRKSVVQFQDSCIGFVAPGPNGTVLVTNFLDNYELKPSPLLTVLDRDGVVRGEFFEIEGGQGPLRPCEAAERSVVRRLSDDLYGLYNAWTSEVVLFRVHVPKRTIAAAEGLTKGVRGSAAQDASLKIERIIPVGDWPADLPAPDTEQNLITFAWDEDRLIVPFFARSTTTAGVYFVEYADGQPPRHIPVPGFWTNLFWWQNDLYGLQWQRDPKGESKIASVPVLTRIQL